MLFPIAGSLLLKSKLSQSNLFGMKSAAGEAENQQHAFITRRERVTRFRAAESQALQSTIRFYYL